MFFTTYFFTQIQNKIKSLFYVREQNISSVLLQLKRFVMILAPSPSLEVIIEREYSQGLIFGL